VNNTYSALLINGPERPYDGSLTRDIVFKFAAAGKSVIRAYRGSSWDTSLQFLTTPSTSSIPLVRMHISRDGKVGIGTTTPTIDLNVVGRMAISPSGTSSDEAYQGSLVITRPRTTGQYINMIREATSVWSIGLLHNTDNFCIARGQRTDNQFTNPTFVITHSGNVGIGTQNTDEYKLAVKGTIRANEIKVEAGWADFVFEDDYQLPTLDEVASHIKEKKHLPNIPSAKEVEENGVSLGEMNSKLLQKIEELTLYIIDLENRMKALENKK